jgi:chromosome segregation ATPase
VEEPRPKENKELENLLRQEADSLRLENRSLKDKLVTLSNDIDRMTRAKPAVEERLQQENSRLRHDLQEIRRDNDFITSECNDLRT